MSLFETSFNVGKRAEEAAGLVANISVLQTTRKREIHSELSTSLGTEMKLAHFFRGVGECW